MSKKRILKEFQAIQGLKPHGIEVSVPSDNIYIWDAKFAAPDQSLYKGSNLKIQIVLPYPYKEFRCYLVLWPLTFVVKISEDYPLSPPTIRFLTTVYHLNIDQSSGHVCLGFISADQWKPTNGIEDVLRAVYSLLITPQIEIAQSQDLLTMFQNSKHIYERIARDSATKYK